MLQMFLTCLCFLPILFFFFLLNFISCYQLFACVHFISELSQRGREDCHLLLAMTSQACVVVTIRKINVMKW